MLARRSHTTILESVTGLSGEGGGAQLAPATTMTKQKLSFATINVKEAGYLFVYLSYDNNSNNWVYFDDFKITHTPTNVIQYNEYYPFGLSTSNSWTREGSFNDYLYNAGSELNASSGWYETLFRGYDPVLGRFMQVDPMASALPSVSPYNFGLNDPVYYNDPMGDYVQKRIPPMYVGRGLNDIFGAAGGSGFYGSLMSGYSVERDARVMSRRDFLMFYGVADSYGRINESRRSEVTTAAATQSGTSLVWCSDCETGTVTGGTAVINGIYHSFTFVEKGAWIPNSATLSLNQAQGGPISIIKSSDQAVINQLVNAIYDARAQGKSDFDLRNYFTEYSLGKKDRKEAFAWVGFSRSLNGSINIPGGGSLKTYINLNLSENWSMLPTWPDGNQLDGKDRNGPYMVYNYYFSGTPNYPGMLIKVYTPTDAASKLANTFIWGR